ncbi:MAG TPA: 1-acyl-sn-glycerol-3-phosphate acyltransferase [Rubricoccaceae bacterium]|nr:1-acyl-sn-glycerol-3-phosphate acyltransferase [Rubricoccaceae bacterium]
MAEAARWPLVELPALPPSVPRRGNAFTRALGRTVLFLLGWRLTGAVPDTNRFVLVAYPHTSNWDGVVGIAALLALGLRLSFYGKHSLFRGPLGWLLRSVGGIPVDRDQPGDLAAQAIARFRTGEPFLLGLAPEGTRKKVDRWKTGFHRIAVAAGVPIVAVALDFGQKQVGPIGLIEPTGDLDQDLAALYALYAGVRGRHPENQWPPPTPPPAP